MANMNWLLIGEIAYVIILVLVCLRIIYDTRSTTKTLAYLLFAVFVPIFGMIFYFSFGINYRHRKMYSKKLYENDDLAARFQQRILNYSEQTFQQNHAAIISNKELAFMVLKDSMSPLTAKNSVKLLINGEQKFPELLHDREKSPPPHLQVLVYPLTAAIQQ